MFVCAALFFSALAAIAVPLQHVFSPPEVFFSPHAGCSRFTALNKSVTRGKKVCHTRKKRGCSLGVRGAATGGCLLHLPRGAVMERTTVCCGGLSEEEEEGICSAVLFCTGMNDPATNAVILRIFFWRRHNHDEYGTLLGNEQTASSS